MGLLGTLGSVAGGLLGGPVGALAGGAIGGGLGKLFGGGGSNNASSSTFLSGIDPNQLAAGLRVSPAEQQAQVNQLLQSIGTLQAQSQNRLADVGAAQGLPAASMLAAQRGNAIAGAQQAQQGTFNLQQAANSQNRQANQFLLSLLANQNQFNQQIANDRRGQTLGLLGGIGQAAGLAFGSGMFGGGGS